jgi:hypothetical protein
MVKDTLGSAYELVLSFTFSGRRYISALPSYWKANGSATARWEVAGQRLRSGLQVRLVFPAGPVGTKKMIARHPCNTQRYSLPLLPPGPDGVHEPLLRRTRLSTSRPVLAERGGFEPPVRCRTHDFQSCTIGLSVTSPEMTKTAETLPPDTLQAKTLL